MDLEKEIKENARRDRDRLEKIASALMQLEDHFEVAKAMTFLTDSLTKINAQLVEMSKIELKKSSKDPRGQLDKEREGIYDEMQDGFLDS